MKKEMTCQEIVELAKEVCEYIMDQKEFDDYIDFCEENNLNPDDLNNNHIYCKCKKLMVGIDDFKAWLLRKFL